MSEYHRFRQQKIRDDIDEMNSAMKGCMGVAFLAAFIYYAAIIGLIVAAIWYIFFKA